LEKLPGETVSEFKFWSVIRQKTYGATEILFMRRAAFDNSQSAIQ
jgi:hypothetical protein